MKGAARGHGRLHALASWLAAWPVFLASTSAVPEAAIEQVVEAPIEQRWWTGELPDKLIRLLPGEALEGAARTLVDRRVEVRLDRDKALLKIRIPLG